jgi:hypothetical protein
MLTDGQFAQAIAGLDHKSLGRLAGLAHKLPARLRDALLPEQARAIAMRAIHGKSVRQPISDAELAEAVLAAVMDAGVNKE